MTIRPIRSDEARSFMANMEVTFGFDLEEDEEARIARFLSLFEVDRSQAAFDGDALVGTLGTFSLDMTVPGGTLPCGGTTMVSVRPTHRRQGILRSMMDAHLREVAERGDPIAALWAADSAIYGRFGYGRASASVDVEISRDHNRFHRLAASATPVRMVSTDEAADLLPSVYERVRRQFPGFFARSDDWWKLRILRDDPKDRGDATKFRYVVTEQGGEPTGYAQYRFKEDWHSGHGEGKVTVEELIGGDPESWAGLWTFLLHHDLTGKIVAPLRSVEEPVLDLLEGSRRGRQQVSDGLWVRIMDPKAALEGRAYSDRVQTVVEVHDPLDASRSVWALDLGPDGSQVAPSSEAPEVTIDLEDLSACYLGWSRFRALSRAGRLTGNPDQIAALDRAFCWSPQPWCPEVF